MRFDLFARLARGGLRLDHVRIERALHEILDAGYLSGFLLEHVDELMADDDPLALGIVDAPQLAQETLACIDRNDVEVQQIAKRRHDLSASFCRGAARDRRRCRSAASRSRARRASPQPRSRRRRRARRLRCRRRRACGSPRPIDRGRTPSSNRAPAARLRSGNFRAPFARTACARPRDGIERRRSSSSGRPSRRRGTVPSTPARDSRGQRDDRVAMRHPDPRLFGNAVEERRLSIGDHQRRGPYSARSSLTSSAPISRASSCIP